MSSTIAALFQSLHQKAKKEGTPLLREGQFISAKVVDILPKNQAVVQLGSQTIKAQLETSLTNGERYLLQVKQLGEPPLLKVMSSKPAHSNEGLLHLLKAMDQKPTKANMAMLQKITKEGMPFTKQALSAALTILKKEGAEPKTKEVLQQMLENQYPIKESVFAALKARESITLSHVFSNMAEEKNHNQRLNDLASMLSGKQGSLSLKQAVTSQVIRDLSLGSQTTFSLLKQAHALPQDLTYATFKQQGASWLGHSLTTSLSLEEAADLLHHVDARKLPFSYLANETVLKDRLSSLLKEQLPLTSKELHALSEWVNQTAALLRPDGKPNAAMLTHTHQWLEHRAVFTKLQTAAGEELPQLVKQVEQFIKYADSNHRLSEQVIHKLQTILQRQVADIHKPQLIEWTLKGSIMDSAVSKEAFLLKINSMVHLSGVQDEASWLRDKEQAQPTLKSLIVQGLQDNGAAKSESMRTAMHLLNGVQLAAQQESTQMLQLSMQLPGELMGMKEDAFVHFESKKNKNGEIDSDSCRIMFYLQLEQMSETVIDLMIVERKVKVTIYNEHESVSSAIKKHKEAMKTGIEQLGYQLISINLKQGVANANNQAHSSYKLDQSGVDVKI
ncbi:hypothetical protein GCM10010954_07230 [Halobacillus andaensis]|uniref:Uncharacterized protein n=1 Tax=Halobacillus andaensis TaxID=1176239 RepID=A0A917B045_HALAA|nr:hypothetical protein [Halobacillus andaensis]MBP2003510.1 hypothetical protein [Halobacillus andaensis]GGF11171.1 hypothetical protein GCM10010954_07230 [Halobacillus andaensis]